MLCWINIALSLNSDVENSNEKEKQSHQYENGSRELFL
jgi:hypothetical protein